MSSSLQLYHPSLTLLTDLYQLTMAHGYWKLGLADRPAVFHISFRKPPFASGFTVACGLSSVIDYVSNFAFAPDDIAYLATLCGQDDKPLFDPGFLTYLANLHLACDIHAVPEGTVVFGHEPLVRVTGPLLHCQLLETVLLNLLNFPTLIATKAARICIAAQGEPVLEFGLRRAQGPDGGITASRAAYIGGCAATSNLLAGKLFGIPVKGTHAHSWVMAFDSELAAFDAYAAAMPNNCVFLVDTYNTLQGVHHAAAIGHKLRAAGHQLQGIRLDSGDLAYLSIQARKILDDAGFPDAAILASNDLDEDIIRSLKEQDAAINVWGVGTKLITAFDQAALGGVYKLSALQDAAGQWQHKIKLSEQLVKTSIPGILQVRRYKVANEFRADMIHDELTSSVGNATLRERPEHPGHSASAHPSIPNATLRERPEHPGHSASAHPSIPNATASERSPDLLLIDPLDPTRRKTIPAKTPYEDLLVPIFRHGQLIYNQPDLRSIRARVQTQLASFHPGIKRSINPHQYPVGLESALHDLRQQMILDQRGVPPDATDRITKG